MMNKNKLVLLALLLKLHGAGTMETTSEINQNKWAALGLIRNKTLPEYPVRLWNAGQWKNLNGFYGIFYAICDFGKKWRQNMMANLVPFAVESSLSGVMKQAIGFSKRTLVMKPIFSIILVGMVKIFLLHFARRRLEN